VNPREPKPNRRLTVQGWQNLVLIAMGVIVLAGGITGGLLINRTDDVSHVLIDEIQPARVGAYRLQAALSDQETATRGYALTGNRDFLNPYYQGMQDEQTVVAGMKQRLDGRPELLADLDAVERAATGWRATYAEPLIASVQPGRGNIVDSRTIDRGKTEFDGIRKLSDAQSDHLMAARDGILADIESVQSWRDRVLIVMIAAFVVTAVLLSVLTRSAVTRPLARLAAACRRITDGHFDESIVPSGPKDIRAIAADVEDMRKRIVAELESTQSSRAMLDEQTIELRRSNAELEQFAYVASHDLQEPLRKVASFCQLLEKRYGDQLDERGTEYIAFAVDGAKRMQVLINDLLTFSRVGRHNATYSEVGLDAGLDDAIANLATAIEESGAEVVRPESLPTVFGDPTLLSMLWQNLVGNALKFRNPDVAPRIVIDCQPGEGQHAGEWYFSVSDNGIGISREFVDKVFVIFQRLHAREVYGGTGIGLALCKKIVEHHGGTIWIDSSYTAGTMFRFTLPVKTMASADSEAPGQGPATVLEGTPP
jgi:signal transduction histidine kinase